jgi:hypothetical protein
MNDDYNMNGNTNKRKYYKYKEKYQNLKYESDNSNNHNQEFMITDLPYLSKLEKIYIGNNDTDNKYSNKYVLIKDLNLSTISEILKVDDKQIYIEKYNNTSDDMWDNIWNNMKIDDYIIIENENITYKNYNDTMRQINKKINSFYIGLIGFEKNGKICPILIWKKIENIKIEQDLYIEIIKHNNKTFNIVQEGIMPGGSKQRMYKAFENIKENEFVYAGPPNGLAQVALGIIAKYYSKSATMFSYKITYLTVRAMQYGVKIKIYNKKLKDLQELAKIYSKKYEAYLCPFGFDSKELRQSLSDNINKYKHNIDKKLKHLWLVAGSATLLNSLYKVFPDAKYSIVQVGKTIWPDQYNQNNTILYKSNIKFSNKALILPPYKTIPEYDGKLWEFVDKYGNDGDYVWNVGSKDIIDNKMHI